VISLVSCGALRGTGAQGVRYLRCLVGGEDKWGRRSSQLKKLEKLEELRDSSERSERDIRIRGSDTRGRVLVIMCACCLRIAFCGARSLGRTDHGACVASVRL
jgi:hypothetical protein